MPRLNIYTQRFACDVGDVTYYALPSVTSPLTYQNASVGAHLRLHHINAAAAAAPSSSYQTTRQHHGNQSFSSDCITSTLLLLLLLQHHLQATRLHGSITVTSPLAAPSSSYQTTRRHHGNTYIYIPPYTALHSNSLILFKGKPYLWLATQTSPTSLQTDPQHRGLILFKGKPYVWLATHPWLATKQSIPKLE